MDILPSANQAKGQVSPVDKIQDNLKRALDHSGGFGKVFEEKKKEVGKSITPMEESQEMYFNKKKDIIEDGSEMIDEEAEETIYSTVNKMKKKLKALADLERRYYGF